MLKEDLRNWFSKTHRKGDWVKIGLDGEIKGPCAREEGEGKPKCLNRSRAESMSKSERAKAARRKRREDPVADRRGKGGKPINVKTEEYLIEKNVPTNPKLWSQAKSLAKKKFDVYPSAYANGWAAKWYKKRGGGWKTLKEERQITMEPTTNSQLDISQSGHIVEKNDEYSMARNQLRTAMTAIKRLMKHVEGEGELKAWVQSKLTKAADYMDSVADYMDSNDKVVKEARELSSDIHTILEAKKSKRSGSSDTPQRGVPGGRRGVEEYRNMENLVKAAAAASAKQPLPKKPSSSKAELNKTREAHLDPHNKYHQIHGHISDITNKIFAAHIDGEHENMVDHARHLVNVLHEHGSALKARGSGGSHLKSIEHIEHVKGLLRKVGKDKEASPVLRAQAKRIANDHLTRHVPDAPKAPKAAKSGIVNRIKRMFEEVELHEGYSVGEMGTDELVNRYKAMTPGQEKHKKTIETIKRIVESRRREFHGYVGPGSTPDEEPDRFGSKPGPKSLGGNPGLYRRRLLGRNVGGNRVIRIGVGSPRKRRSRRI